MSGLSAEQRDLARLLFSLPEAAGYALAGGAALVALQVVDRATRDLDAFIGARSGADPGSVETLASALTETLAAAGYTVEVVRRHPTFCRIVASRSGLTVEIDLAVDSPPLRPLEFLDGVPVLAPLDLAARKILAILDRAESRDFSDLWALSRALGREACVDAARQLDVGVTKAAISGGFMNIERLTNEEFPVPITVVTTIRKWYAGWRDELAGSV